MAPNIFVTGATGAQGGALIKAIIDLNKRIDNKITAHCLVRNPSSASSYLKNSPNVKIFQGDFDDAQSIKAAMSSCSAAFLNVTPVFTDPSGEARHLKNLVQAAASNPDLTRVVFSSSGAMHDRPPSDPVWSEYVNKYPDQWMSNYMSSKRACEDLIVNSTQADFEEGWTIVRGSTFFTNFIKPSSQFMYPELETKQRIITAVNPSLKLSALDPSDMGPLFARVLLSNKIEWDGKWKSKFIPAAKQNITFGQIVDKMNAALADAAQDERVSIVWLDEDEASLRTENGDMITGSQLFQNKYQGPYDLGVVNASGVDLDAMKSVEGFFKERIEDLIASVGGSRK